MTLSSIRGETVGSPLELSTDFVVVGSGPAGAAVARTLARSGAKVVVVEEGPEVEASVPKDGFTAMSRYYRDMGTSLLMGRVPIPFLQGRVVGGTSVINGAISWRLPRDVFDEWTAEDPSLLDSFDFDTLSRVTDDVERDLHISPTDARVAGRKNLIVGEGAERLGWEHRPISRNVRDCEGKGRCLEVCPVGAKQSMDRTYLRDAVSAGAVLVSSARVTHVVVQGGRATSVKGVAVGGADFQVRADHGVILAASAIQTPLLLRRSGLLQGPVGDGFQCHPGVSLAARFSEPIRAWLGATQGHEVTHFRKEGIKLEVLGYDPSILLMRTKGIGSAMRSDLENLGSFLNLGAAIRARAKGRVREGWGGRAHVRYELSEEDLAKIRRGVRLMGELCFAAGATEVYPGIHGAPERIQGPEGLSALEVGPRDPRCYSMAVTHMFGTARMGTRPETSVVDASFQHHAVRRLFVTDSSIFPSNTGVNPQTSILAFSTLCGRKLTSS